VSATEPTAPFGSYPQTFHSEIPHVALIIDENLSYFIISSSLLTMVGSSCQLGHHRRAISQVCGRPDGDYGVPWGGYH
jgi:hypothetical protein